jgi:hypothetical protein
LNPALAAAPAPTAGATPPPVGDIAAQRTLWEPYDITVHSDAGYGCDETHALPDERGLHGRIAHKVEGWRRLSDFNLR